jgi:hypothetical protein
MKAVYQDSWRVIVPAAAIALAIVGCWERYLRAQGYASNFVNLHDECRRRQWDVLEPSSIVVLGSSEVMAAIDLTVLEQRTGRPARSLARFGTPPDLALDALGRRDDFRGVAIVSFTPGYFRANWPTSALAVGIPVIAPPDKSPAARLHTALSYYANRTWRFRSRTFWLSSIVDALLDGRWKGDWQAMNERLEWLIDDSDPAHVRRDRDAVTAQLARVGPPVAREDVDAAIARLRPAVEAIRRRGGDVVFVTLHVGAEVASKTTVSRTIGWEPLCRGTGARCIYGDDRPALRRWEPGDGIHLDLTQRAEFTSAFAEVLCEEAATCVH